MTACQSWAIKVCSAVLVVLLTAPICLTSFKAAAYSALANAGGGSGPNCVVLARANGVTIGAWVKRAGRKVGGVGCQLPGMVDKTYSGGVTFHPSLALCASIRDATT